MTKYTSCPTLQSEEKKNLVIFQIFLILPVDNTETCRTMYVNVRFLQLRIAMNAKKKAAEKKKESRVEIRVTESVLDEIDALAAAHGCEDNRSKYIEMTARGLLIVDRKKAGLE